MLRQTRLSSLRDSGDTQSKLMMDRINFIEKLFTEISTCFFEFTRKTSRLCEKYDEIAKTFNYYSEVEAYNKILSDSLSNFSKAMTVLGDSKEMEVHRLESKVIGEFQQYDQLCKTAKDELKICFAAKEKETVRRRQLEQIRQRSLRDRKKLSSLEAELKKSKIQLLHSTRETEEIFDAFEKEKLKYIKTVLLDFIAIEMKQHCQAIEVLTATYQDITEIDEEKDFQSFKQSMQSDEPKSSGYLSRFKSQSMGALNSIFSNSSGASSSKRNDSLSQSTTSLNSPAESPALSKSKKLQNNKKDGSLNRSIEELSNTSLSADEDDDDDDDDDEDVQSAQSQKLSSTVTHLSLGKFCEGTKVPNSSLENTPRDYENFKPNLTFKSINGISVNQLRNN